MLEIKQLETGYGKKQVLFGLSLQVQQGEIVAIIGSNGCGKSTILKTVVGVTNPWHGEIWFNGVLTNKNTPSQNVRRKLASSLQGNRIFDQLTVLENLRIGGYYLSQKQLQIRINETIELFPILQPKLHERASKLSGGQQQLLSLARTLISNPCLILLDEPSLGLSPHLLSDVFEAISRINKETGTTILIVEQRVREVLRICDRVYGIKLGRNVFDEKPENLLGDSTVLQQLFL
jgi:branched-chain amino acid transport system ATP-binding protein